MLTLTFRVRHDHAKGCLRRMLRDLWPCGASRWGVLWWQEYQARGVVHYHVLMDHEALVGALYGDEPTWTVVGSGKAARTVLGGVQGHRVASFWVQAVGDTSDAFWSFQVGGILERLSDPEQAARYVASYVKKLGQKTLPDGEAPQGRWWWMSPQVEPLATRYMPVQYWPYDRPHRLVFHAAELAEKGGVKQDECSANSEPDPGSPSAGGTSCHNPGSAPEAGSRRKYVLRDGSEVRKRVGRARLDREG